MSWCLGCRSPPMCHRSCPGSSASPCLEAAGHQPWHKAGLWLQPSADGEQNGYCEMAGSSVTVTRGLRHSRVQPHHHPRHRETAGTSITITPSALTLALLEPRWLEGTEVPRGQHVLSDRGTGQEGGKGRGREAAKPGHSLPAPGFRVLPWAVRPGPSASGSRPHDVTHSSGCCWT